MVDEELQHRGWKWFASNDHVQYSPHYQSWLWACFLWAYDRTGYEPYLTDERERPSACSWKPIPTGGIGYFTAARSSGLEPCCLWPGWSESTTRRNIAVGSAWWRPICWLRRMRVGRFARRLAGRRTGVASNEEYGTGEVTIIQQNGDTICDSLYTCNFALIGLHEAASATGDPLYANAEKRLADFLCRIQIRSPASSGTRRGLVPRIRFPPVGVLGQQRRLGMGCLVHGNRLGNALDRQYPGSASDKYVALGSDITMQDHASSGDIPSRNVAHITFWAGARRDGERRSERESLTHDRPDRPRGNEDDHKVKRRLVVHQRAEARGERSPCIRHCLLLC